jgi:hypothetical protein
MVYRYFNIITNVVIYFSFMVCMEFLLFFLQYHTRSNYTLQCESERNSEVLSSSLFVRYEFYLNLTVAVL